MREIVVISGKGGAGKTSITGAFAHLAQGAVLCDLDVDAPDLHILLQPEINYSELFISGHEARIDQDECLVCGECQDNCRFDAISYGPDGYMVDPMRCEGCKVCVAMCPAGAMQFVHRECGEWFESTTRFGTMLHARLHPGEENSGRLVALLKQKAREKAEELGADIILADGAPGIGCPVISSFSGTDLAVAVTEPTPSGVHDLERVMELARHFNIPVAVLINKYDLNPDYCGQIETLCETGGHTLLGRLPLDGLVTKAMCQGQVITEYGKDNGGGEFVRELEAMWLKVAGLASVAA